VALLLAVPLPARAAVRLGFSYPRTGSSAGEGRDQWRGATLAVEEINAAGGILGEPAELVVRDSHSSSAVARRNVEELVDREGARMVFGGVTSGAIVAASEVCQARGVPFFASVSFANATTGSAGNRFTFREGPSAWMGAKALVRTLGAELKGKRFYYLTTDAPGGLSLEESLRAASGTTDVALHPTVRMAPGDVPARQLRAALEDAERRGAQVLVLALGGRELVNGLNMAAYLGLKKRMLLVVPNLSLAAAQDAGARSMTGVVGVMGWHWKVPAARGFAEGQAFVARYTARYGLHPSAAAAATYTIVHEFKAAAERARSLAGPAVVRALEGHTYERLNGPQTWRGFDHQSVQSVYVVRGASPEAGRTQHYHQDYLEVVGTLPGPEAVWTRAEWEAERRAAGKPPRLEPLPGET
jgi:ABC-type branched-subunit amino acid transport system substrate-binding protein